MDRKMFFPLATVWILSLVVNEGVATYCHDSRRHYDDGGSSYCLYGCCGSTCCKWKPSGYISGWVVAAIVCGCVIITIVAVIITKKYIVSKTKAGRVVQQRPANNDSVFYTGGQQQYPYPQQQQQQPYPYPQQQLYPQQQQQQMSSIPSETAGPPPAYYYKDPPPPVLQY